MQVTTMVFDQVGGNWVAVGVGSTNCGKADGEVWEVFRLQPRPDGTLAGESNQTMAVGCANKRPVTFTRTGDVDVDQPSRPGHPAAAGGVAGRSGPRPLPRNGHHAEWFQRGGGLRRPYQLPAHRAIGA